jgi:hypothetical protein
MTIFEDRICVGHRGHTIIVILLNLFPSIIMSIIIYVNSHGYRYTRGTYIEIGGVQIPLYFSIVVIISQLIIIRYFYPALKMTLTTRRCILEIFDENIYLKGNFLIQLKNIHYWSFERHNKPMDEYHYIYIIPMNGDLIKIPCVFRERPTEIKRQLEGILGEPALEFRRKSTN